MFLALTPRDSGYSDSLSRAFSLFAEVLNLVAQAGDHLSNAFLPKAGALERLFWPLESITPAVLSAQKNYPTSLHLERGLDHSSLPLKLYF